MNKKDIQAVVWPFVLIALSLLYLFSFKKGDLVLLLNGNNTIIRDVFFKYYTHIGDSATALVLALVLLAASKMRWFYQFTIGFFFQLAIVMPLKHIVFDHSYRPYYYYNKNTDGVLHLVEGLKFYSFDTFPSGHTATAFFIFTFFAFLIRKWWASVLLFLLAILVGVSRMYLAQHFFKDVYFGMLFGFIASCIAHYVTITKQKIWYNKSFWELISKK